VGHRQHRQHPLDTVTRRWYNSIEEQPYEECGLCALWRLPGRPSFGSDIDIAAARGRAPEPWNAFPSATEVLTKAISSGDDGLTAGNSSKKDQVIALLLRLPECGSQIAIVQALRAGTGASRCSPWFRGSQAESC